MSKLSVHISGNPTGLGALLQKCAQSNSPVSVIYSVNQNIADAIASNSPGTKWIYRRQTDAFNRLPNAFYIEDPTQNARKWLSQTRDPADKQRTQVENWRLNPATWYDPLNEPVIEIADPDNPAQVADAVRKAQWLNTWMITALNIADGLGFKLALFSFPTGSPPLLTWNEVNTSQIQVPPNPECQAVVWHYLLPALRHGKQSGAVLSLHAYWEDRDPSVDHRDALRHRDLLRLLPSDAQLPIVISEASSGNGYDTSLNGQPWINDMIKWDIELMKDPIILAGCAFQLGVGTESNLAEIMPPYGAYIAAHPTPIGLPPKLPEASPDGTMVPPDISITDSMGHVWSLGATAIHGKALLRDGMQFADGQGELLLYHGQSVYTRNDLNQWFVATATAWQAVSNDPRPISPTGQAFGIDVSHHQGGIDWSQVKASGQSFAFIKATESNDFIDDRFVSNWRDAKAAGLPRSAYHFYRFAASPQSQADLFLSVLGSDRGELPPVVDVEDTDAAQPNVNELKQFLDAIQQRTGRRCIIYTADWFWNTARWGAPVPWAKDYDLWVAHYDVTTPDVPADWTVWKFWQHTDNGTVNGIAGAADLDFFNGTADDLKVYIHNV